MDKYRNRLPKEEIKRFAKEISKKLVASDYKNGRVEDPTKISPKQEKKVRAHVKGFFDRAVEKHRERERRRAGAGATNGVQAPTQDSPTSPVEDFDVSKEEEFETTGGEAGLSTPSPTLSDRKRKRDEDDEAPSASATPSETPSVKRVKDEEPDAPSPPPPPPPPPAEAMDAELVEEERAMREQEEALIRENEEAQRWEEAERMREREAALDFGPTAQDVPGVNGSQAANGGSAMDLDGADAREAIEDQTLRRATEHMREGVVGQ